jgi:hypothetical protein
MFGIFDISDSTFVTYTSYPSSLTFSFYFSGETSGNINTDLVKMFSNKFDSTNLFDKFPNWAGQFEWNGSRVDSRTASTKDDTLTLLNVVDTNPNPHFAIKVINGSQFLFNKPTFNTSYKNNLQNFINKNSNSIAFPWLQSIIFNIPTT